MATDVRSPAGPGAGVDTAVRVCANCGAAVPAEYCGHCGQRAEPRLVSLRELFADIVEDQLSVNGTLVRTVVPLVTRPGLLTRDYLNGRIVRYIPPFRLFLACMTVWLLAATYQVHREQPKIEARVRVAVAKARAREAENARLGKPTRPVNIVSLPIDTARLPALLRAPLRPVARRYAEIDAMDPGQAVTLVEGAFLRSATRLMLVLVPVVAALLQLVYYRRRRVYAEHFVFTLHLHAFWFVVLATMALLPNPLPVQIAGNLWLCLYTLLALKRVYGGGWVNSGLHSLAFGALYLGLISLLSPVMTAVMLVS
jgi:hypothetical protein